MTEVQQTETQEKTRRRIFWVVIATVVAVGYMMRHRLGALMDEYKIDPAVWLDSPTLFYSVVGVTGAFILFSVLITLWAKLRVSRAEAWGRDLSDSTLVSLLGGTEKAERIMAFTLLQRRLDDALIDPLVRQLRTMDEEGADPRYVIYLLEDLEATKAIPALRKLAKNVESRPPAVIRAARNALERIPATGE